MNIYRYQEVDGEIRGGGLRLISKCFIWLPRQLYPDVYQEIKPQCAMHRKRDL